MFWLEDVFEGFTLVTLVFCLHEYLYIYIRVYIYIWSNYSDLTRPHPKWWFSKGHPLISGKSRLVKYYNLARIYVIANMWKVKLRLIRQPGQPLSMHSWLPSMQRRPFSKSDRWIERIVFGSGLVKSIHKSRERQHFLYANVG